MPDFVAEYGLEGVNVALKNDLSFYVQTRDELTDQKVVNPVYRFKEIPALLQAMNEAGQIRKRSQEYVQADRANLVPGHGDVQSTGGRAGSGGCV